jgi:uncharacterized protein YndB with AHSA1/START domain
MSKYEWSRFVKRISIDARAEDIYDAWATRAGLESWFLSKAEFTSGGVIRASDSGVQKGDTYSWNWHGFADYEGTGEILLTNEKDFLEFTFSGGCIVSISVKEEAGETICELTQMMPQEKDEDKQYYYIECGKGWTFYMANLKSILEGGIDLRNRNNDLEDMINA